MENFDYIILGAGSAGCVLANRLSENPNNKVFLIDKNSCEEWPEQDKNLIAFKLADKINSVLSANLKS